MNERAVSQARPHVHQRSGGHNGRANDPTIEARTGEATTDKYELAKE
jgi:hypothetical protein